MATWNLVNADQPALARSAIKLPSIVQARDNASLVADGETDVSAVLTSVIDDMSSGQVLQLDAGSYYVPTLRDYAYDNGITIQGVPGKTKLLGDGTITEDAPTDDVMFDMRGGSIRLRDIIVEDAGIVLGFNNLAEQMGDIYIESCEFTGCGGVAHLDSSAGFVAGGGDDKGFTNFRMTDCNLTDCSIGLLMPFKGGWDSFHFSGNALNNIGLVGVWIGGEGITASPLLYDRDTLQPRQSHVMIHDNSIRGIAESSYDAFSTGPTNGILAIGQYVSVHDNVLEDIGNAAWGDAEGIYTKARFYDVHDNILINAGGSEAAINLKGAAWSASTTLDASMNGDTLPESTITVADTTGFPTAGAALVESSVAAGWERIEWTGKTATTLTGATGGTGTLSTGGAVVGEAHGNSFLSPLGFPGKCHDNIIVFTLTDRLQTGIHINTSDVHISGNLIFGATDHGVNNTPDPGIRGALIENNTIMEHHGEIAFYVAASRFELRGNRIVNMDGSYAINEESVTSLKAIQVRANNLELEDITIDGNAVIAELDNDGTLSAGSAMMRVVHLWASGSGVIDHVDVLRNRGKNTANGIFVSSAGTVSYLRYVDNDWQNENEITAPSNSYSYADPQAARELPTYS